jgi:voltage-gated potassium channel
VGIGSAGYWYLGWRQSPGLWSLRDCIYMTAITITTVGFEEVLELEQIEGGREWTLALLLFGISANLYVISSITTFFVDSDFINIRRYRREKRLMTDLSNHYIVCGTGRTGSHVVQELLAVGEKVIGVDTSADALDELRERGVLTVRGDATDDEALAEAGLARAKGLVVTLDDDKTNMYVVLSARQANPRLRIVAKAVSSTAAAKLRRAGADAVVSPTHIGGLRLASELLRPQVVRFLDEMLRDRDARLRIEEAHVGTRGPVVGLTLKQAKLRERSGVLILAVRAPDGELHYVPPSDLRITPGHTLIAIGRPEEIVKLREVVGDPR